MMIRQYNTRSRSKIDKNEHNQEEEAPVQEVPTVVVRIIRRSTRTTGIMSRYGSKNQEGPGGKDDIAITDDKSIAPKVLLVPEILNMILSNVKSVKDLTSCNLVSKLWNGFVTEALYKTAKIHLKNGPMVQNFLSYIEKRDEMGLTPRAIEEFKIWFCRESVPKGVKLCDMKPKLVSSMKIISHLQKSLTMVELRGPFVTSGCRVKDIPLYDLPRLSVLIYSPEPENPDLDQTFQFEFGGHPKFFFNKLLENFLEGSSVM